MTEQEKRILDNALIEIKEDAESYWKQCNFYKCEYENHLPFKTDFYKSKYNGVFCKRMLRHLRHIRIFYLVKNMEIPDNLRQFIDDNPYDIWCLDVTDDQATFGWELRKEIRKSTIPVKLFSETNLIQWLKEIEKGSL